MIQQELYINQLAATSSSENIPHQLSGNPDCQPRARASYDPQKHKAPPHFIARVYLISVIMILFTVIQWTLLAQIPALRRAIVANPEYLLFFYWISFLQLLVLIFFYDLLRSRSLIIWYIMLLTAVQTSSTVLALPIINVINKPIDLVYAGCVILVLVVICFLFSILPLLSIEHTPEYVIVGGIRIFMMCSVVNLVSQTTTLSPYFEVVVAITIIPFVTFFTLVCSKTIGTEKFYALHGHRIPLCALSSYYCYLALYANFVTFFNNIELTFSST